MRRSTKRTKDRRIQKTESDLREALHTLIGERPYDAIAVKEILSRANVGRSTFYTHFRSKDGLLVDSIRDMLRSARTAAVPPSAKSFEGIISFSLPIFEKLERHTRAAGAKMTPTAQAALHARLQQVLSELIADDLRCDHHDRGSAAHKVPSELIGQYAASTFILVLNWWLENQRLCTASEVNDLFRALVVPTLAPILD
jgi:AcrR family transcriptional regulator